MVEPGRRAYVQRLGGDTLYASLLLMPLVKFAGPTDPPFLATLDGISHDTLVRRYEPDSADGLPGSACAFSLCTFWYVAALTRGQPHRRGPVRLQENAHPRQPRRPVRRGD